MTNNVGNGGHSRGTLTHQPPNPEWAASGHQYGPVSPSNYMQSTARDDRSRSIPVSSGYLSPTHLTSDFAVYPPQTFGAVPGSHTIAYGSYERAQPSNISRDTPNPMVSFGYENSAMENFGQPHTPYNPSQMNSNGHLWGNSQAPYSGLTVVREAFEAMELDDVPMHGRNRQLPLPEVVRSGAGSFPLQDGNSQWSFGQRGEPDRGKGRSRSMPHGSIPQTQAAMVPAYQESITSPPGYSLSEISMDPSVIGTPTSPLTPMTGSTSPRPYPHADHQYNTPSSMAPQIPLEPTTTRSNSVVNGYSYVGGDPNRGQMYHQSSNIHYGDTLVSGRVYEPLTQQPHHGQVEEQHRAMKRGPFGRHRASDGSAVVAHGHRGSMY